MKILNLNKKKNKKNNHAIEDENIDDPGTSETPCQSLSCELNITEAIPGTVYSKIYTTILYLLEFNN